MEFEVFSGTLSFTMIGCYTINIPEILEDLV